MSASGRTVRAAVVHEVGAPFVIEEIELAPTGPHDVRVKMAASGVCHSDLSVQKGTIPFLFPTVLGHEGAGVVVEVGEAVTRVAPGDHVVLTWMPACRRCFWCLRGQAMLCEVGLAESLSGAYATVGGTPLVRGLGTATFGEETLVPEGEVVRVDPSVPLELAALVGCALATGVGAVWHTAHVTPGSTVAVVGCGGVGLSVIQGARLAGATTIVAVDQVASKLDTAKAMGATAVVDASSEDAVAAVRAHTGGRGADFGFEVVGRAETIRTAVRGGAARGHGGARRRGVARRAGVVLRLRVVRGRQDGHRLRVRLDRRRPGFPGVGRPGPTGSDRRRRSRDPAHRARRRERRLPGHGGGRGGEERDRLRRRRKER